MNKGTEKNEEKLQRIENCISLLSSWETYYSSLLMFAFQKLKEELKSDIANESKAITRDSKFPCLGISSDGSIIYFVEYKVGVNLITGCYSDWWLMDEFTLYDGEVTVSNKILRDKR